MKKKHWSKVLILCGLSSVANAQYADSLRSLEGVTVSASRLNQTGRELGRNVTVIAGTALQKFPVSSLDDLLRCLPSVGVQSRGSFGVQADLTLRGSTFNQVLVLIDGMRANDPLTGHFNGMLPVAPAEIEQIEIVRGAGSALYGPDAVGGIINIVTKTFSARKQARQAVVQGDFRYGEWNFLHLNTGGFLHKNKLRLGGGVLHNSTSGQLLAAPATTRNDLSVSTYTLSAAYDLTPRLNLALRAAYDHRDFNAQWFYTTSTADLSRETTDRRAIQGQVRFTANARHQTELQVSHASSSDLYVFNPAPTFVHSRHRMGYTNAQLHHVFQVSKNLRTAFGGQYDVRRIASNDRGDHATTHGGLYALASLRLEALLLTGSLRYDHDQAYGSELTPQLNASYAFSPRWVLRGSVGRSIRAADFTERYVSNNLPGPLSAGRNIGYAGLKAERATQAEIGTDVLAVPGLTFKLTAFLRNGSNLIDYVNTPGSTVQQLTGLTNVAPNRSYRLATNLYRVSTRGLETELWFKRRVGQVQVELNGGFTFLENSNGNDVPSQYLALTPRQRANANVWLSTGRLDVSVGMQWLRRDAAAAAAISRTLTPTYAVLHSQARFALLRERLYLTAQVQNLTDVAYADLLGAQMPRRWFSGGIRWQLGK